MKKCEKCGATKARNQFYNSKHVCDDCRAQKPAPQFDVTTRKMLLTRASAWITPRQIAETTGNEPARIGSRMRSLYEAGMLEQRVIKEGCLRYAEYRITGHGKATLDELNTLDTPVANAPVKERKQSHFAWLDLCANERPNYTDNRRYVPDTSGQRSYVI